MLYNVSSVPFPVGRGNATPGATKNIDVKVYNVKRTLNTTNFMSEILIYTKHIVGFGRITRASDRSELGSTDLF
jgi:hypothetical protein